MAEETIEMEEDGDNAAPLLTTETKLMTDKDNTEEIIAGEEIIWIEFLQAGYICLHQ